MQPSTSGAPSTLNERQIYMDTPVGKLLIKGNEETISAVLFVDEAGVSDPHPSQVLLNCVRQMQEYFDGSRMEFELPVSQQGTDFQQTVWLQLCEIPYAATISYQQLANRIGNPKSIRAVGTTNGRNQISIIVPCHRVIGSNGSLTGYAGGLWRKRWLLDHEHKIKHGSLELF